MYNEFDEEDDLTLIDPFQVTDTPLQQEKSYEIKSPLVREYMANKMSSQQSSPEPVDDMAYDTPSKIPYIMQSLAAGIRGQDPTQGMMGYYQALGNAQNKIDQKKQSALKMKQDQKKQEMDQKLFDLKLSEAERGQEKYDPNSAESMRVRKTIEARFPEVAKSYGDSWSGFAADDIKNILDIEKTKEEIQYRKDQLNQMRQSRQDDLDIQRQKIELEKQKEQSDVLKQRMAKEDGSKLTTGSVENLASSKNALAVIDSLAKDVEKFNEEGYGPFGRLNLGRYIPGTDTNEALNIYDAKKTGAAKTIGRYLEGGKLTDEDAKKYESMLPTPNDNPTIRAGKLKVLKELVQGKLNADTETLKQSGYRVPEEIAKNSKAQKVNPNAGNTIIYKGQRYTVDENGDMRPVTDSAATGDL